MSNAWRRHNLRLQEFEKGLCPKQFRVVAGVDEAGRGPLAGPVVACAIILKRRLLNAKINDSKKLSACSRMKAFKEIIRYAHIGIGVGSRDTIDKKNILQATIIAMQKAANNLEERPEFLLIDGRFRQDSFAYPHQCVVGGDKLCFSIACASIVAKVVRDTLMSQYAFFYPEYNFECNRGYYTREHMRSIQKYGLTPIHRLSFSPIRDYYLNTIGGR